MSLRAKAIPEKANIASKYSHIALEIQRGLASLREDEVCTDFEVVVNGRSFHCHKAVLAAVSDYFRAMLQSGMKETVQNQTTLDNISPEAFKVILDLLYFKNGDADPINGRTDDELTELLRVADMFQMKFLSNLCLELFAKTMAASNCVERWKIGKTSISDKLRTMAWKYIIENFEKVAKESVMLSLDYDEFLPIISNDFLEVTNEIYVWQVISDWIEFDRVKREEKLSELLKNCCLTEIDQTFLVEDMTFDEKIRSNALASKLVQRAIKFHNHPGDHGNMDLKLRNCMDKEQMYMLLGVPEGDDSASMICYSARYQQWKVIGTVPESKVVEFACCVHGRDVFVSGGTGRHGDLMHKCSSVNGRWTLCGGKMSVTLKRHAMVATDDSLYVLGGRSARTVSGVVLQFCLNSEKWDFHGELMAPVENASAVCMNYKIYLMGGVLNADEPAHVADSVQMYDTRTKAATILQCQLPSPCAFSCATSRQDEIFIVTCKGEIVRLSGRNLESHLVATIPDFKGRKQFGFAMRGDKLAIYGGVSEDEAGNKSVSDKVAYADVASGKVWDGKALSKRYAFYGSVKVVLLGV